MHQKKSSQWNAKDYAENSSAQAAWANELISKLALKGNESFLDIGCGNGQITYAVAQQLTTGFAIGIDFSESMISLATQNCKRENLSFQVMNAMDIKLDHKFDMAFSNAALHWVKDHQAVLSSLKNHLNPNARILFQMGGQGNAQAIVDVVETMMHSSEWAEYFKKFEFPYAFYDVAHYEKWLTLVGYKARRVELIEKDMVHAGPEGLKGWLRTTWFPYTDRLPDELKDPFLTQVTERYLSKNPVDVKGQTHVKMIRLEVEAVVE